MATRPESWQLCKWFFRGKVDIKMNLLSCFSDPRSRKARDSRTLESFPDGKNSDARNIYLCLLGAKGSLGLFDKQLERRLACSRPHLNLPQTLGSGVHCFHSSEKGTETSGVKWPAQDHSATILSRNGFNCFLNYTKRNFLVIFKRSFKFVST